VSTPATLCGRNGWGWTEQLRQQREHRQQVVREAVRQQSRHVARCGGGYQYQKQVENLHLPPQQLEE
jgi:hypothetical protein